MVGLIYVVFVVAVVDKEEVDVVWIEDYALLKLIGWLYYLNVFVGVVVVVVVMMMMHKLNL
jgi:hypothetical protein